jgi:transposase
MTRKNFPAEEKVAILKEHFEKQISVADLCEKYRLHPNQFYRWKKDLFENAADIFITKRGRKRKSQTLDLEAKLKERNEVIAELLEENLKLKKFNGGL